MKTIEIHVPNKSYDGYIGGVHFERGVGVFTDIEVAKRIAEQFNYELVEVGTEAKEEPKDEPKVEPKVEPKATKRPRKKAEPKEGE